MVRHHAPDADRPAAGTRGSEIDRLPQPVGAGESALRHAPEVFHRRVRRGAFDFDLASKTLYHGDAALPLTKSEYAICEHLATHAGQVFSKEQIYEAVFGYDGCADDSAVTEHVKNIRAKLKAAGGAPIETVWGIGYKWKNEEM